MRQDFCDMNDHNGAVHRCIHAVSHLIEDHAEKSALPVRFAATKAIEGDPLILKQLQLEQNDWKCWSISWFKWRRSEGWIAVRQSLI